MQFETGWKKKNKKRISQYKKFDEGFMNTRIIRTTDILGRLISFLGTLLVVAFLMPAVVVSQSSPATVNLGTSGDFVIIAKSGISTTGTTHIDGDLGVSPITATAITGFGLIMDVSNTFSISSLVTGRVFASNYTTPTPTKMTTAVGDMETAYTNAAGRTLPDYTELYTGNLTGRTLTRGLYKWSTGVLVSAGGVTISGSATDIWIFQIAQNLELTSGAIVTLSGGALASNIFWQVAGQVTLGTTVAMKGIILCKTLIVMSTGASLNGRALAQTAVTLDANAITSPGAVNSIGADARTMPVQFTLEQNFPNPFNPSTKINYTLPFSSKVTLDVYNITGQRIGQLVNEEQPAGYYSLDFNSSSLNRTISSGVYFYQINAVNKDAGNIFSSIKKMIFLK